MPSREQTRWKRYQAEKAMRQVRKQIKQNRKTKRPRRKDWAPDNLEDLEALDELSLPQSERVMPRGERERRQSVMAQALSALEETQAAAAAEPSPALQATGRQGVVVEVSSGLCRVDLGNHSLVCGLRGSLSAYDTGFTNVVAVGDEVIVSENGSDRGVVEAVLPRRSVLARPDVFHNHLQQVIVANADQLLIVASWRDPIFWPELVDRYLISAERNKLRAIICVNKIDLVEDAAECQAVTQPYLEVGHRVLLTSALDGEGVDALRETLRGQMTVLAGMSGVGKSSLLMAVQPDLQLRIAEVSDYSGEGRHTTSQVNMLKLRAGGFVVDTPGIREFGLSDLQRSDLPHFYPEIAAAAAECRFADCSHTHEPGCAVKVAVRQGRVSQMRYHSYKKIYYALST